MNPLLSNSHFRPQFIFGVVNFWAFVSAHLITSPPKLEVESERIVWFQLSTAGNLQKFELKCLATGDPERYEWLKNGRPFAIQGEKVKWQRAGQSGSILFYGADIDDQGFYQCRAINIFGVAVSSVFEAKVGSLGHFPSMPTQLVTIEQGSSLSLPCQKPQGDPEPSIFWLLRDPRESSFMESINKPHLAVDDDGNLHFSYVQIDDGKDEIIYQCAATSPVLHGEYKTGIEFKLRVQPAEITPRDPTPLWLPPDRMNAFANEMLRITCIFGGYPLPQIVWSRSGEPLSIDRISYENYGRSLIIRPVHSSDEGEYVCRSGNYSHTIQVDVITAPQWLNGLPENLDLPEEAEAELKCLATGVPFPVVNWYKNGIPIDLSDDANPRRHVLQNGQVLRIVDLQHKIDRGVYQCNVSNSHGYVFANAYLNIRAHAPEFKTKIDQTIRVVLGSTVDLDCDVVAAPLPKVKWTNERNRRIKEINRKLQIMANHTLRITSARFHDAGVYFCSVSNKFGINKARRRLEVYKSTYFVKSLEQRHVTIETGAEYEFSCHAEADDRLDVQYIWQKDDADIDFETEDLIIKNSYENGIKIAFARGRHSGVYKCIARTLVDQIQSKSTLLVKDVPEAPIVISIQCETMKAVIKWLAAYDNYAPIYRYIVDYHTDFRPNVWKLIHDEKMTDPDITDFNVTISLSPWVNYTFRIAGENYYGRGEYGYYKPNFACKTPASFPYTNPTELSASGTIRDNFIVRWKPMDKESWNAPGLYYKVFYRREDVNNPDAPWLERRIEDPFLDFTEIREVPIFTRFQAKIKSFNKMGESLEEPKTVTGYTGEEVPFATVKNVRILKTNATCVTFAWDPAPIDLVNGHFRGYKVKSWPRVSPTDDRSIVSYFPEILSRPPLCTVCHFEPMQRYSAQIFVTNTHFESEPSEMVDFSMPEGPPGPVQQLNAIAYGSSTVLVKWLPPLHVQGHLKVYHIKYVTAPTVDHFGPVKPRTVYDSAVPADVNYHLNDALSADSGYIVFVWAETGGGNGPYESQRVDTWNDTIYPTKPTFHLEQTAPKRVLVTWIPSLEGMPGSSFYVNYSIEGSEFWRQTAPSYLPSQQISIDDLLMEQMYIICVHSREGKRTTQSDTKTIVLQSNTTVLFEPVIGEEAGVSALVWYIVITCIAALILLIVFVVCFCYRNRENHKYPTAIERSEVYTYESPLEKRDDDENNSDYETEKKEELFEKA